jgi:hypothetical protein
MKIKYLIIILTIIGFILRIYNINTQSYWIDEGYTINAVIAILQNGYPLLETGNFYGFSYLTYLYLTSFFVFIFGLNEFSTRIVSVIFGTLLIPLIFIFTKKITNEKVAIFAAFITTFFTILIAWSRQSRSYMLAIFLFVLSLYFYYNYIENYNIKNLIYCFIATVFAFFSHPLTYSLVFIYIIHFLIHNLFEDINIKKNITKFFNKIKQIITKNYIIFLLLTIIAIFFIIYKQNFILNILQTNANYALGYYLFFKTEYFLLFYFAAVGLLFTKSLRKSIFLALCFLIPFYFVSFHQKLFHFRYLLIAYPAFIILASLSMYYLFSFFKNKIYKIIIVLIIIISLNPIMSYCPKTFYSLEKQTPMPDFKLAYEFIKNNEKEILISSYTPIAKIYYKDADYAIDFSLSGMSNTNMRVSNEILKDRYRNIDLIKDKNHFLEIINNTQGYIVLDSLSMTRINNDLQKEILKLNLSYYKNDGFWNQIFVYSWK